MSLKLVLVICALVAVAAAVPAQGGAGGWGAAGGWGGPAAGGWGGAGGWAGPGGWGGAGGWGVGVNPWIPPWISAAPWYPQWVPCTGIGSSCTDCSTRLVCTKVGGLQRACTDPTLPYCNLGECSATPSAECAPATDAPAETTA